MPSFRVTKYDPRYRDRHGHFTREDWTSMSDIGRAFDGVVLTLATYIETEGRYLQAVAVFMTLAGVHTVNIRDLENSRVARYPNHAAALALAVEGKRLNLAEVSEIARLCLREVIWCRLEGAEGLFVDFGWDYYMYIGGDTLLSVPPDIPGLFVEAFASPYQD